MRYRIYTAYLFLFFSGVSYGYAQNFINYDQWSKEPSWLKLVHYEASSSSPSGYLSAVHSPDFFLDPVRGPTSPEAEIMATVQGMLAPVGLSQDEHPQCKFPARKRWLSKRLGRSYFPHIRCPKFDEWTRDGTVESLSIVLATGYLGNPASYYGHTLLKMNFPDDGKHSSLQDVSVNYGAILTGNDDPLTYMIKGVAGGYEGGFSHIQYYFHNHNYGENELRDLWEYRLNLPKESVDDVLSHAWEVLGKKYDYYFFRRNCAYRMAEIVQILDGVELIPESRPYTIPQALLLRVNGSKNAGGEPLVNEVVYHPSRQSRFYASYQALDESGLVIFTWTVEHHGQLPGAFEALGVSQKYAVLDALIDYYQFIADGKERATGKLHQGYVNALSMRYSLPPGGDVQAVEPPVSPATGRAPSWIQFGMRRAGGQDAFAIRLRPAYYDALDAGAGHVDFAGLSMGDAHIEVSQGRVKLKRLDLVSIDSTNPGATGLPGDRGKAWKLRFGLDQARLACNNCTVVRVQGDVGMGRSVTKNLYFGVYAGGAVQNERSGHGHGFGRLSADLVFKPQADVGIKLAYEYRRNFQAVPRTYPVFMAELRYALSADSDIRLRFERDGVSAAGLAYGVYW